MNLKSLDPRVDRLGIPENWPSDYQAKVSLDQFEAYESFIMVKDSKPFEHAGPVHASSKEMAFLFAKEQYSRRGMTCYALCVVKTENIYTSEYTDNGISVYEHLEGEAEGGDEQFEVFHLLKRGKQHKHAGSVMAKDHEGALVQAKNELSEGKPAFNVWIVKTADIMSSDEDDVVIWDTLKEKKYREAIDYRAQDRIKAFKERQAQ